MVKLGMGGRALYVFVRAVSVRPNMEPDVKEETAGEGHHSHAESQSQGKQVERIQEEYEYANYQAWWVVGSAGRHWC